MTLPTKPTLDYSYTAFAQGLGNGTFPGSRLDNDLANLKDAIDETIDFTSAVIRADGKLQNGVVTAASLDTSVTVGVSAPRPRAASTAYAVNASVSANNGFYICVLAHTSSASFASDFGAGFWQLIAQFSIETYDVGDGTVTEPKHATGGVSARALATGAVETAKIANGAVTAGKLATPVGLALLPVGAEIDFAGAVLPSGWLFERGQAVSRSTYSALFAVLCPTFVCTTTSGSPVLTAVTGDFRDLGLEGAVVEGTNIPVGATVTSVTATTITISANATGSATSVSARMCPFGAGDGSTTFTLPDARDRLTLGRGNMGGTAAARILNIGSGTADVASNRLGAVGDVERIANRIIFTGVV